MTKQQASFEFAVYNTTGKTQEEIEALEIVGVIRNQWRLRTVVLYRDPANEAYLYMVGLAFTGNSIMISHESIGLNEQVAMDYWKHGRKTLVRT